MTTRSPRPFRWRAPRRIALLGYPDVNLIDITAPLEVFANCCRILEHDHGIARAPYGVEVIGTERGALRTSAGIEVMARRSFREVSRDVDTLLVAGGEGIGRVARDREVVAWIREMHGRVRRLGAICTGASLLAEAGLLDGRRATTHWRWARALQQRYPAIQVDEDAIFVKDRGIYTSAGVTAGIDLALALLEEDLGRGLALATARSLVVFLKRPGGQSQYSAELRAQGADEPAIARVQEWVLRNLKADLSVDMLAAQAAMTPRTFARHFARAARMTPAKFVEEARIEAARRRLEESDRPIELVAAECGFGNAEHLRRSFQRRLGVSPLAYRARFRNGAARGNAV
ncbi:MAG: DJ-1/PfpI family protein [Alphaproteobacteria bacterium]|nr:DJ-1/PfpI family protein [Alphaproteobacteria bacterium]